MDELVRWLGEQLDIDTVHAKACAGNGEWSASDIGLYGPELSLEVRTHMAEHDPARVLREIEAKRQMLTDVAAASASALDMEHGCCHEPAQILAGECPQFAPSELPLVRLLALPYSDRPGYAEALAAIE